jgi:hypothetical protein
LSGGPPRSGFAEIRAGAGFTEPIERRCRVDPG